MSVETLTEPWGERTTVVLRRLISDENGTPIPGSSLESLTCSLTDLSSGETINDRDNQDVLGANGGTTYDEVQDPDGDPYNFEMEFAPEDTAHMGGVINEAHCAVFRWTYDGGKTGMHRVFHYVTNEPTVSA